jgi:uncharacterized integral membrane protein
MAIFIFAILFSLQNNEVVTLRFGLSPLHGPKWAEVPNIPLFLVVLGAVFVGVFIGGMGDLYKYLKLKNTLRQHQRTIERLEREILSLQRGELRGGPPCSEKRTMEQG